MAACYHSLVLPWSLSEEEERRFRRIFLYSAIAGLVLSLAIPVLPLPKKPKEVVVEIPPRLARLILEKKEPPPPPRVEAPKPKPRPKPAPKKVEKPKVKPKPKAVAKKPAVKPRPEPKPQVDPAQARKKAAKSGVLAFQDTLADLRDLSVVKKVSGQTRLTKGAKHARRTERSMITAKATAASGGINTATLSRDVAGVTLAERTTTKVQAPVGHATAQRTVGRAGSRASARTIEEIQMVFDRNKGKIYSIYNRALRKDPTLEGKMVLRLTIAPSGKVVKVQLVSSELKAPELEKKVLARIRMFDFGARDVSEVTITYPIDFLPA